MGNEQIKVIVVDDHQGVRTGVRKLIEKDAAVQVVAEAASGSQAIEAAASHPHDVVLLDVELPKMRGDAVAQVLTDKFPSTKILAISSYDDPHYVRSMLKSGAKGYITKDEVPAILLSAIHGVARGEDGWLSQRAAHQTGPLSQRAATFTETERNILRLLSAGHSLEQISNQLDMGQDRLNRFVKVLEGKLEVQGREKLAQAAASILGGG